MKEKKWGGVQIALRRKPYVRELRGAADRKKLIEKHSSYECAQEYLILQVFTNPDIGSIILQVPDDHPPPSYLEGQFGKKNKLFIIFKHVKIALLCPTGKGWAVSTLLQF